jgi:hypothetical protein
MTEPVALEDIKRQLVLDPDDTAEDAYLGSMIAGARRACELRTRRTIVGEDRVLTLAAFPPAEPIRLGWPGGAPLVAAVPGRDDVVLAGGSVAAVAVKYFDTGGTDQTLASSAYFAALGKIPAELRARLAWPATQARPDAVRITYTLSPMDGGDLEMIRHAIRLIVGNWYANREAAVVDARGTPTELPIAVTWLLDPLCVWPNS